MNGKMSPFIPTPFICLMKPVPTGILGGIDHLHSAPFEVHVCLLMRSRRAEQGYLGGATFGKLTRSFDHPWIFTLGKDDPAGYRGCPRLQPFEKTQNPSRAHIVPQ